jgi:hypothetical protein
MPAITVTDLNNAKTDVDHVAAIATSTALTATDRLGRVKKTLEGALATLTLVTNRGAWLTATVYSAGSNDLALQSGTWYRCVVTHTSGTFATDLAAGRWVVYQGNDAATVQFTSSAVGAAIQTLEAWLNGQWLSLQDFGVPAGDVGSVDRTAVFLAAVATGRCVRVPTGMIVKVSDWIELEDDQTVWLEPGARINQITADKGIFRATSKTRPRVINDGILHGPGVYSNTWTGNGAHQERGVMFEGCTDSVLAGAGVIRNFGHSQACFLGGSFRAKHRLEGTNDYSTPISAEDNFQIGYYVTDDDNYGPVVYGELYGSVSGVCQGVLRENRQAGAESLVDTGPLKIDITITDIPGQHGIYIQRGNLEARLRVKNIALSACKLSTPIANAVCSNFDCTVVGEDIGSHLFEVEATEVTGTNQNLHLVGVGKNIGGAGLAAVNGINSLRADIQVQDAKVGFQAQGVNQKDVEVKINGRDLAQTGVAIYATNSDFRIHPVIRECNQEVLVGEAGSGILVSSASATVDLINPDVTDADANMRVGLFNFTSGSIVRVHGRAVFTGAATFAVRSAGKIRQWPTDAVLQGASGDFLQNGNVRSDAPFIARGTSTSASNIVLWLEELEDESASTFQAIITGKLRNSSERRTVVTTLCVYRDAGGSATIQGSADVDVDIASGSFAGVYAWAVSGNQARILVNSGGTADYDWTARVVGVRQE